MKTLKQEIEENTRFINEECECCSSEVIEIDKLYKILKDKGIDVEQHKTPELRQCDINELYDFIVGSNLEYALIHQCKEESKPVFEEWLQLNDEEGE